MVGKCAHAAVLFLALLVNSNKLLCHACVLHCPEGCAVVSLNRLVVRARGTCIAELVLLSLCVQMEPDNVTSRFKASAHVPPKHSLRIWLMIN